MGAGAGARELTAAESRKKFVGEFGPKMAHEIESGPTCVYMYVPIG